mmetsp:Transcript_80197/g.245168  ORF Transcript_80197/g.245168 Transcript_80197/m.245168 type:complete len:385 (+) Transcript_80197:799-1953(+)
MFGASHRRVAAASDLWDGESRARYSSRAYVRRLGAHALRSGLPAGAVLGRPFRLHLVGDPCLGLRVVCRWAVWSIRHWGPLDNQLCPEGDSGAVRGEWSFVRVCGRTPLGNGAGILGLRRHHADEQHGALCVCVHDDNWASLRGHAGVRAFCNDDELSAEAEGQAPSDPHVAPIPPREQCRSCYCDARAQADRAAPGAAEQIAGGRGASAVAAQRGRAIGGAIRHPKAALADSSNVPLVDRTRPADNAERVHGGRGDGPPPGEGRSIRRWRHGRVGVLSGRWRALVYPATRHVPGRGARGDRRAAGPVAMRGRFVDGVGPRRPGGGHHLLQRPRDRCAGARGHREAGHDYHAHRCRLLRAVPQAGHRGSPAPCLVAQRLGRAVH